MICFNRLAGGHLSNNLLFMQKKTKKNNPYNKKVCHNQQYIIEKMKSLFIIKLRKPPIGYKNGY